MQQGGTVVVSGVLADPVNGLQSDAMLWAALTIVPLFQRPVLIVWRDSLLNIQQDPLNAALGNLAEWGLKA